MLKRILAIFLGVGIINSYADQYEFLNDSTVISNLPQDNIQDKKIIVNRTFNSFNELVNKVRSIGFDPVVKSYSGDSIYNISVNFEGTNKDFIRLAATKFGYKVEFDDDNGNKLEFIAINPLKNKPMTTITRNKSEIQTIVSAPIKPIWMMSISDKTLRNTLSKWCQQANWQLFWKVKGDTPIQANWNIQGDFEYAINEVLKASQFTELPLKASMFDGNRVLEITSGQ